jgi:hypothetical protein
MLEVTMAKNWKLIAKSLDPEVPESQLEKVQAALQALEVQLSTLMETLSHDTEPATIFVPTEEHT